ncbi:hypothetical protein [Ferruginibacter sp. SUN106]|uniref:hypothetical protein n=1 Tax=Ferruginibacter sp. SUN106 TaxID=2978348 RepID=UPI003D36801A
MKKYFLITATLFFTAISFAQKIPLGSFLKWHTNNAPDCKNVVLTKDSIVLPVKNKCRTEGQLENWRPGVDISEGLKFKVTAAAKVQLTITYKFLPIGNDIFRFGGQFTSNTNNSDNQVNGTLRTEEDAEHLLPSSGGYTTKTLLVTFSDEIDNPIFKAAKTVNGELVFDFSVTNTSGQTHQGSKAVIKSVVLEIVK